MLSDKVEASFYKENYFLGILTNETLALTETYSTTLNFAFSSSASLDYGKYKVRITGIDKAGNRSETKEYSIQLLSETRAKELLEKDSETNKEILEELREKTQISLPALEKKAVLRKEKEAEELNKVEKQIDGALGRLGKGIVSFVALLPNPIENAIRFVNNFLSDTGKEILASQESFKEEIRKTNKETSDFLRKGERGLSMAYQSIKHPLINNDNIFSRFKVASSTFIALMVDPSPTQISNVMIEEIGLDYAVVSWKTNHFTFNNKVNYGKDTSYGQDVILNKREKYHQARLTNLEPGSKYFFEVMSQGKNYVYDAYYSFETKEK